MTWIEAVLLGVVQGVTEFLPISSDGHLNVAAAAFDTLSSGRLAHWYITMLHAGSVAAVLVYFWKDLGRLATDRRRELVWIVLGTIPVAVVGVVAEEAIEGMTEAPILACGFWMVNGLILFVGHTARRGQVKVAEAGPAGLMAIALSQILALLPGISRSGTTIATALRTGLDPEEAFRFSFLLGLPAIVGAVGLKVFKYVREPFPEAIAWGPLAVGLGVTFLFSLGALWLLSGMVRRRNLLPFAVYCFLAGAAGLAYFALR